MAFKAQLQSLIGESLSTVRGHPFSVDSVTENTVYYNAGNKKRPGQLAAYDEVIEYLRAGNQLNGPGDIQKIRPTDRNAAYEWAVLKKLNIVQ